jgi:hypothetical protein
MDTRGYTCVGFWVEGLIIYFSFAFHCLATVVLIPLLVAFLFGVITVSVSQKGRVYLVMYQVST